MWPYAFQICRGSEGEGVDVTVSSGGGSLPDVPSMSPLELASTTIGVVRTSSSPNVPSRMTTIQAHPRHSGPLGNPIDIEGVARPSIRDFEILKVISKGAYGVVYLARFQPTGVIYAVKVLKKEDIKRKNIVGRVLSERDIMVK